MNPATAVDLTEEEAFALIRSQSGIQSQSGYGGSTGDREAINECANVNGASTYCGHDHQYSSEYKPQELPSTLYTIVYKQAVIVRGVRIVQHKNGINCIKVEVDGKSIGNRCLYPIKRGRDRYEENSIDNIYGYCNLPSTNFLDRPRISYCAGKINQHFDTDAGIWKTDPDGSSGSGEDKLKYCQKWYPSTTSISGKPNTELISFCGGEEKTCSHISREDVFECIGATVNTCTCPNGTPTSWYNADDSGATF